MSAGNNSSGVVQDHFLLNLVSTSIISVLCSIGIVGNLMVILVVLKVKGMMTPTNCYLVSLAFSDFLFCLASTPTEVKNLQLKGFHYPYGAIGCALLTYLPYLSINASSLSMAAFTVERYIGICHPMRAKYICTVRRAKIIIIGLWMFSLLYNSSWFYLAVLKLDDTIGLTICTFRIKRNSIAYKVLFLVDMLGFYFTPLFLYFVLYGRIAFILLRSDAHLSTPSSTRPTPTNDTTLSHVPSRTGSSKNDSFRHRLSTKFRLHKKDPLEKRRRSSEMERNGEGGQGADEAKAGRPPLLVIDRPSDLDLTKKVAKGSTIKRGRRSERQKVGEEKTLLGVAGQGEDSNRSSFVTGRDKRKCGRTQVVKMLAVIVVIFASCWFPYRAMVLYNSFASRPFHPLWFIMISKTLIYVNCAINPILYNVMSGKFRQAFQALLPQLFPCCLKKRQERYDRNSVMRGTTRSFRSTLRPPIATGATTSPSASSIPPALSPLAPPHAKDMEMSSPLSLEKSEMIPTPPSTDLPSLTSDSNATQFV